MNKNLSKHSSLFLLELIAAIFFFCLAGAVCIRFFVKSHTLSQDTRNLDMAVNEASSAAELFKSEDDLLTSLEEYYPDGKISKDRTTYTIYYNNDFEPCKKSDEKFVLTVTLKEKDVFILSTIKVVRLTDKKELYTLETEKYVPGKGGRS